MQPVINIYTLKINSISGNASVNIGESLHTSHTSNTKSTGANMSYGDEAPSIATMKNLYVDPDEYDQTQIKSSDHRQLKEA
ncbi:spore germination protein [Paenibacillus sp. GP183]|uniref:spore germination protein n=1 Tax=Paenibacillus sp. GP183 TaxID=1882751 RepID=UPI000898C863|nr:spore germination protein [Paenibacillus sp. GP183]SEB42810.1 Spore germination protein gerPA/gerPF [Paenibacillus sp. GP183]